MRISKWRRVLYGVGADVLAVGLLLLRRRAEAVDVAPPASPPWTASGVIQARRVSVASELGGRIASIPVREGGPVAQGDVVAALDPALLEG